MPENTSSIPSATDSVENGEKKSQQKKSIGQNDYSTNLMGVLKHATGSQQLSTGWQKGWSVAGKLSKLLAKGEGRSSILHLGFWGISSDSVPVV